METVIRISGTGSLQAATPTATAAGAGDGASVAEGDSDGAANANSGAPGDAVVDSDHSEAAGDGRDGGGAAEAPAAAQPAIQGAGAAEAGVDRIIDSHDNEFVLSSSRAGATTLTLDPQLVQVHSPQLLQHSGSAKLLE